MEASKQSKMKKDMGELGYGETYGALLKTIAEEAEAIAMRYFRADELLVRRRESADDASHAIFRDARQPRHRRRRMEGGDVSRSQAVGEPRCVGLR